MQRSVEEFDVAVAGLGAMGSATAYHLATRGQRVLGLDAFSLGHTRGSSHGETRIIRLSYAEHPDYVPLLRRAYALWRALEAESGESLLRLTGGLYLGPPDGSLVAGALLSAQTHGLTHELLDAAAVRRRFPAFQPQDDEAALYESDAGMLYPERCIAAHCRLATQAGATLRFDEPLLSWRVTRDGVALETRGGTYRAGRLVITAGAWLGPLLGSLGALGGNSLPLSVERNAVFWFRPAGTPSDFVPPSFPVFIWDVKATSRAAPTVDGAPTDAHFYGLPPAAGGTAGAEAHGVKVARHHTGIFVDPNSADRQVTAADESPVRNFLRHTMPALDGPVERSLACLYTLAPDGHFIVDRHPEHPEVVFASACSGHGFKFASVVGEVLASLALHGEAPPETSFLKLDRFRPQNSSTG